MPYLSDGRRPPEPCSTAGTYEPIAVVGIACRFPGDASSPERFWELLQSGKSAYSRVPHDRFNIDAFHHVGLNKLNAVTSQGAHFLAEDVSAFDAPFFNITPNEARAMDPQQRLLLEVSYEAFENAGLPIEKLAGSDTGCFVGCFTKDYSEMIVRDSETSPMYAATGTSASILSNRISWFYDLKGPSLTLDTACSSSLVGVHLACQSLHSGESRMAVVGGSNLMLSPDLNMWLSNLHMLAPDGLSKAFDDRADGYGRGEGVASVILKPLADAIRDGNTIRAVIRGTGVNQDGKTPGITLPNSQAQEDLIRSTYTRAGLDFQATQYFEAHGTGTSVGDPIELGAIGRTFGACRASGDKIIVGSAKTNVGHLEGAAGLAGLIKGIYMVERGLIPPSMHFKKANPRIPFDDWNIEIPTEKRQWPSNELRRVSINSFGFGGTNAHAILDAAGHFLGENGLHGLHTTSMDESIKSKYLNGHSKVDLLLNGHSEPKPHANSHANHSVQEDNLHQKNPSLFVLSAQDRDTVNHMKQTYAEYLRNSHSNQETTEASELSWLHDLAFTLGSKRSRLPWKAYSLASSVQELSDHWGTPTTTKPVRSSGEPRIGFVFTGQGAQWPRMGVELLQYHAFEKSIQEAEIYLRSLGCEWSVVYELKRQKKESKMDLPKFSQPLCTIVQVALVKLLRSWNISPGAVVGHSSGEIAAAYCCGAISSEDAYKIAYYRGIYSSQIRTEGAMMAVGLPEKEAQARVSGVTNGRLVVACINSPVSVTISGDCCAVDELHDVLNAEGVFVRKLKVDNAYHSHHMEVVAAAYLESIGTVPILQSDGSVRMFSSVTGKAISPDMLGPSYWIQNLVSPVRFSEAVSSLLLPSKQRRRRVNDASIDLFLELGPHPALRGPVKQILEHLSMKPLTYCSILERGKPGVDTALEAAGTLFTSGSSVDLSEVNRRHGDGLPHTAKHLVDLPPYPWNHTQKFWHESRISKSYRFRKHARHDLLGAVVSNFNPLEPQWRNFLKPAENPWIRDHVIQDSILYPAAGLVTMVLEAARQIADSDKIVERYDLRDVQIGKAVLVPDDDIGVECTLQMRPRKVGTRADVSSWFEFTIFTSPDGGEFQENCSGLLAIRYKSSGTSPSADIEAQYENKSYQERYRSHVELSRCAEDTSEFYESMASVGLKYGPAFQNVSQIRKGDSYCCSRVRIPDTESMMPEHVECPHLVHPGTLDCMFQTAFAALGTAHGPLKEAMVPIFIASISLSADQPHESGSEYVGYSESSRHGFREIISDIVMSDLEWEEPKITIKGFRCTELSAMTGMSLEDEDLGKRKKMASNILWKPDIDLVSTNQLTQIIENAVANEVKPPIPISTEKLEMVGFVFIQRLLKNVPHERVDIGYVKMFHEWMQARFRSVEEGKHPHQTANLDWMNLGGENEESLIAEARASGSHGEALCAIGENLIKIVTGEIEPLQILLENDLLYRFYREAREMKIMNSKLIKFLELHSHKNPDLSILEIGAGTGGTTHDIVSALGGNDGAPRSFSHYTFTDIGPAFCEKAEEAFSKWRSSMSFRVLDIEQDPSSQGFEEGKHDIVIATSVLHATQFMDQTLSNTRKLLKPGGTLCLVEPTNPLMWVGLIFGCLSGWWSGEADGRHGGPLMSVNTWDTVLRRNGFNGVDVCCYDSEIMKDQQLSLMIASRKQEHDRNPLAEGVIILEPAESSQELEIVASEICGILSTKGVSSKSTSWTSDLAFCRGKNIIALMEVESPFLKSLIEQDFLGFKQLVNEAASVLWVVRGEDPAMELIFGMTRTMRSEMPDLKFKVLHLEDVSKISASSLAKPICDVATAVGPEPEFVFKDDILNIGRYVEEKSINEMIAGQSRKAQPEPMQIGRSLLPLKLEIGMPGMLDTLYFSEDTKSAENMESDEVEFEVKASGLNFRDVMVAMGQIPDGTLGFEASGIVTRVGSNTTRLKVGDRVCTIGKGTHKTLFRSKEMLCQLIPEGLSFEEAASLPLIHSTAFQALVRIARIRKGQSVLIHAAAGGVGQAAIQLAKHYKAEIFATVGSEEKKRLIMDAYDIPADHILNSRDLSFSKGIMRMTNGRGVDIVLNSLSGEALRETWHCIAPFGTFVEIGIKDILSNSGLDMLPFLRDATFAFVNLEHIGRANPTMMAEIMEGTFELLRSSVTKAVTPLTTYPASQIEDAFRVMQTGQHKGKVVISYSDDDIVPVLAGDAHPLKLDPNGTYVLVGGLGGLGRSLATFLVKHGARHLAFLSRSGPSSDQAKSVLQILQEEGVDAKTYQCDTAEASQLSATIAQLSTEMPPIRGLINGAMVLRDAMFQNMTHEQWATAIRPKVHGSWNLHSLIPNGHLDFFILLSSNVGIFGNRGQANYAAGCTFQDALARHRRSKGQKATSIDLGIMLEIGYIAETGVDALKDWEFSGLNESEFHTIMKAAITGYSNASTLVPAQLVTGLITGGAVTEFGIDTPYYHDNPQMAVQTKTGKQDLSTPDSGASSSLQEQLSSVKSLSEAAGVVTDVLVGKVAKSLRTDVINIEIGKPLHSFGVDSLVAVEIRNWIFREIKSEVSLFDVMSSVPISVLAEKVAGKSKFVAAGVVSEG